VLAIIKIKRKRMTNNILRQVDNRIENLLVYSETAIVKVKNCTFSLGKIPNAVGDVISVECCTFKPLNSHLLIS
jgi:hypothetical protein